MDMGGREGLNNEETKEPRRIATKEHRLGGRSVQGTEIFGHRPAATGASTAGGTDFTDGKGEE
jgi:hypothetical protein